MLILTLKVKALLGSGVGPGSLEAEPEGKIFVHIMLSMSGEGGQGHKWSRVWSQLEMGLSLSPWEPWGMHYTTQLVPPWVKGWSFLPFPGSVSH